MRKLCINPVPCTGCMCCMAACSQTRAGDQDLAASSLRVVLDVFGGSNTHVYCRQCDEASCASACPTGSIRRDADTGAWIVDYGSCVRCGTCRDACPFGAVFWSDRLPGPIRCDLCGGSPECVEACRFGAIRYLVQGDPDATYCGIPDAEKSADLGRGPRAEGR